MPKGFVWKQSGSYAVPRRLTHIKGTTGETFVRGEALGLSANGQWTKLANGLPVAGICNQNKAVTANDNSLEVLECRANDVWEAPYTGAPAAGFVVGCSTADISADGLSVLASDVTGGAFAVIEINTNKSTCMVQAKNRQLS